MRYEEIYNLSKQGAELNVIIVETFIGNCLHLRGKYPEEAVKFLETTDFKWKENAILCGIAAHLYYSARGDVETALALNKLALELQPENINLLWNLSLNQLRGGELEQGLKNYEVRFSWPDFPVLGGFLKTSLDPEVNRNSGIMLWWEQGIGDQLNFFSAVKQFKLRIS